MMICISIILTSFSILTISEVLDSSSFTHSYTREFCTPMLWTDGYFDCKNSNYHILRLFFAFSIIGCIFVYWSLKIVDYKILQGKKSK